MKIILASDHAGFDCKSQILRYLSENQVETLDLGTDGSSSVDYPDYALKVAQRVSEGLDKRGILICGTGIGMSIVANKLPGVRAALCHNLETAEASRRHNDANILILGARVLDLDVALSIVALWLKTPFEEGRHQRRLDKLQKIEQSLKSSDLNKTSHD